MARAAALANSRPILCSPAALPPNVTGSVRLLGDKFHTRRPSGRKVIAKNTEGAERINKPCTDTVVGDMAVGVVVGVAAGAVAGGWAAAWVGLSLGCCLARSCPT